MGRGVQVRPVRYPYHFSFVADQVLPRLFTEPGHDNISSTRRSTILLAPLLVLHHQGPHTPRVLPRAAQSLECNPFFYVTALPTSSSKKNGPLMPCRTLFNAKGVQRLSEGSRFSRIPSSWSNMNVQEKVHFMWNHTFFQTIPVFFRSSAKNTDTGLPSFSYHITVGASRGSYVEHDWDL